ncbi:hypothetical protein E8E13_002912 [Curvularia kusanoi]|uniref:Heterokaryon incompatibility domain-containing protein n=1 Tax=Curvularia kusanoi TaxID=90978 RepID=A0A9P4W293_CURKU|nr:hypothetical protein E8E13_002912 [Curvularia kusanoi]
MRLLQRNDTGEYTLTKFTEDNIPQYAILSHTWGDEDDEVSLTDLEKGTAPTKPGYRKLNFCAKQAAKDGISYFWIDTCCIDQSSSADVSRAINSMFAWYSSAATCYVYLSDVSTTSLPSTSPIQQDWFHAFKHSRWFTRGWTLQELLAPESVHFFSADGKHLGSKEQLLQELHSITNINIAALNKTPLSAFSFDERMSWTRNRQTKLKEDLVYSLLGIFDIHMPLLYGEGYDKALVRLKREYDASQHHHPSQFPKPGDHITNTYHAPVFNGAVTGRNVITGPHVTGGSTMNFNFG